MDSPFDILEQAEAELAAHHDASLTGVDRRQFMFYSLVAAAASAIGAQAAGAQSALAGASEAGSAAGGAAHPRGTGTPKLRKISLPWYS